MCTSVDTSDFNSVLMYLSSGHSKQLLPTHLDLCETCQTALSLSVSGLLSIEPHMLQLLASPTLFGQMSEGSLSDICGKLADSVRKHRLISLVHSLQQQAKEELPDHRYLRKVSADQLRQRLRMSNLAS